MTTTNVDDLIQQLKLRLDALGDGRDCRSENEKAIWFANCREIGSIISGLQNPDLDKPTRLLAAVEAERAAHLSARAEIEEELAVVVTEFASSRERDNEHDRRRGAEQRLRLLDRGELLYAPGQAYARLADLDERIAQLQTKVERLQRRHAGFLEQAQALLGVTA
jgi:hypothetical protein